MRIDQSILTGAYASSFLLYADVHIPVMNIFLSVACLSYHSALCIFTVTSFSLSLTSPYILPTFVLRRVHECGKNCRRCGRQGSSRQAQHDLLGMCVLHCLGPSLPFSRVLLYKCPGILSSVFFSTILLISIFINCPLTCAHSSVSPLHLVCPVMRRAPTCLQARREVLL